MSARPTSSRLAVLWAVLGLALLRFVTGRSSTPEGASNSAPRQTPQARGERANLPSAALIAPDWRAFLKRDVGWLFGILYLLAMLQAAFFAYDQILNDSALETAAVDAISQHWQRLRSR
jgi:hypothetical protein